MLQGVTGMDDTQLQMEALTHRPVSNDSEIQTAGLLAAARLAHGRQEHQRDVCQAGQSRLPLSPTEEHRMHVAAFVEKPQQRPESGNAVEMQMRLKVIANFLVLNTAASPQNKFQVYNVKAELRQCNHSFLAAYVLAKIMLRQ